MCCFDRLLCLRTAVLAGHSFYIWCKQSQWRKFLGFESFFVKAGKYITGLPGWNLPTKRIFCFVAADSFVFARTYNGPETASFRRPSVNSASLDDRTTIKSKITVPRVLTLGLFALAAPANVYQVKILKKLRLNLKSLQDQSSQKWK